MFLFDCNLTLEQVHIKKWIGGESMILLAENSTGAVDQWILIHTGIL